MHLGEWQRLQEFHIALRHNKIALWHKIERELPLSGGSNDAKAFRFQQMMTHERPTEKKKKN